MPRILLVDDDQTSLDLEKAILYEAGYEVIEATSPLVALELLELYNVDLLIVDIQMPRLNGLQFVDGMRNVPEYKEIPVAFLTASLKETNVVQAAKLGADFYIVKPLVKKEFLGKIAEFFVKHPSKESPGIKYSNPLPTEIKINKEIQICSISEIGIEIIIDHHLDVGQVIQIPPSVFQDVFSESPLLKVLTVKSYEKDLKKALLVFVFPTLETIRKVQRFIYQKNQPAEALKYPKFRA